MSITSAIRRKSSTIEGFHHVSAQYQKLNIISTFTFVDILIFYMYFAMYKTDSFNTSTLSCSQKNVWIYFSSSRKIYLTVHSYNTSHWTNWMSEKILNCNIPHTKLNYHQLGKKLKISCNIHKYLQKR